VAPCAIREAGVEELGEFALIVAAPEQLGNVAELKVWMKILVALVAGWVDADPPGRPSPDALTPSPLQRLAQGRRDPAVLVVNGSFMPAAR
jgi:hypothetical protein